VFQGFHVSGSSSPASAGLIRFQNAVSALFARLNKTFIKKQFEFSNDLDLSVKRFLARFDAIFSLNQDLLLEIHYFPTTLIPQGRWSGVVLPGMTQVPPAVQAGPFDLTMCTWVSSSNVTAGAGAGVQPFYKLHGSSNWLVESGERLLIMAMGRQGPSDGFLSSATIVISSSRG
jgi:hypothetical protein